MAATEAMIERLRRMTGEVDGDYEDETLAETIERYPLLDSAGLGPDVEGWVVRYDLNAAAVAILEEKVAQAMAEQGTATTGAVKAITDQGTSITYGAAGAESGVANWQALIVIYRRKIAPRLV